MSTGWFQESRNRPCIPTGRSITSLSRMARQGNLKLRRGAATAYSTPRSEGDEQERRVNFESIAPASERASSSEFFRSGALPTCWPAPERQKGEERDGNVGQYQRSEEPETRGSWRRRSGQETAPIASQAARAGEHRPAEAMVKSSMGRRAQARVSPAGSSVSEHTRRRPLAQVRGKEILLTFQMVPE